MKRIAFALWKLAGSPLGWSRPMASAGTVASLVLLLMARHEVATQTADTSLGRLTGGSAQIWGIGLGLVAFGLFTACTITLFRRGPGVVP